MAEVKVFAENIEDSAQEQIDEIAACPAFEGAKIRIMPDAHRGKGCVIGFTAKLNDKVIPNLVGVDIGCGMFCIKLAERIGRADLIQFNRDVKRAVPTGFKVHRDPACSLSDFGMDACKWLEGKRRVERSLGTLGGGNHFIELDEDEEGAQYLVVHSGSRNLGKQVAEHHQALAQALCKDEVPEELKYLERDYMLEYLADMHNCQQFANKNRETIIAQILERTGIRVDGAGFTTMHNYISDDGVIRKGAISAQAGETVFIPFNMRDGAVIATGKGNEDWNCSAPHGAGRAMSRSQAFATLDAEAFVREMKDAGIYSPSACDGTLDESPDAYKAADAIMRLMEPTAQIVHRLKPIWNLKATGRRGSRR